MSKYPLPINDFVRAVGTHQAAADALRVSRPTVTNWISRNRQIFVVPSDGGGVTYYEIRAAANG